MWPAVTVFGFVVLACVVIALGTRSTARYEFERNRVQQEQAQPAAVASGAAPAAGGAPQAPAGAVQAPGGGQPGGERSTAGRGAGTPVRQRRRERAANHPAGRGRDQASAWWLVDESAEQPGTPVLAGPFPDRIEAEWAALSGGLSDEVRAVFGARRPDGALVRRQSPQERAWLAQLGRQLDRLPEDWDELLTDTDALTTLLVEVAAAVVEAGLPLHDCAERSPADGGSAGGVCLIPDPGRHGVLVSWRQHDRMSLQQVRGADADGAVQRTMNAAVAAVLAEMGFRVTRFGSTGCHLVTAVDRSALTP